MTDFIGEAWDKVGGLTSSAIPDDVREVASQSILDWFGCAVVGSHEPLSKILRDEFATADGAASLIGSPLRSDRYRAAMINGAAGHALDFDDSSQAMGGHPSAPLVPAILAEAELAGATGADAIAAYVVGAEVQGRLGLGIGRSHYGRGWHVTSTIGVFGAAAAGAHLLGLDEGGFRTALNLAASNASGVKANFGTMTKPLHPGQAAERGLMAARLAARGYTAASDAIGANQGFAQAAGDGVLDQGRIDRYGSGWCTMQNLFKFHAACHLTHAGIEATGSLLADAESADVDSITLTVNPMILDVCGIPDPTDGLSAKFSLRGTQSFVVHGVDTAAVDTYTDAGPIQRSDVQQMIDRVAIETDTTLGTMETRSAVTFAGGDTRTAHVDVSKPANDLGAQRSALETKFNALVAPVLGEQRTSELADLLANLDNTKVADLQEATR